MSSKVPRRVWLIATVGIIASCVLSGCGSSPARPDTTTSSAPSSGSMTPAVALSKAYAGTVGQPPASAPRPASDVSVWIVSCGQQSVSCNTPTAAAEAAARTLGWTTHVCDGQLNPAGMSACVRQAIVAKPQAILPIGLDCPLIQQPLVEADQAGIKTIAVGGLDCSDTGGKTTYSGVVQYLPGVSAPQWWAGLGALRADWIIGRTNGNAQVLALDFTDAAWSAMMEAGFEEELATCSGCHIVAKLKLGNQDLISGTLRTKFSTALLQHPTANAISVPLDAWFPLGLAQAVTSSGRSAELAVIGTFGEIPNMDLIRDGGGETASAAFSAAQVGWAGIDETIRVLAGQPTVPEGIGYWVIDKDHNLPAAGQPNTPPEDYVAAYKRAWGVG